MPDTPDIAIDFKDVTDERRMWATRGDVDAEPPRGPGRGRRP